MKVFVYFNLHKKLWSVKCIEPKDPMYGKVIAHKEKVTLLNAKPKVSEAGRQRVLKEKRKNVHAGVVGEYMGGKLFGEFNGTVSNVTYNPYKYDTFVYAQNKQNWLGSPIVYMDATTRFVLCYDHEVSHDTISKNTRGINIS